MPRQTRQESVSLADVDAWPGGGAGLRDQKVEACAVEFPARVQLRKSTPGSADCPTAPLVDLDDPRSCRLVVMNQMQNDFQRTSRDFRSAWTARYSTTAASGTPPRRGETSSEDACFAIFNFAARSAGSGAW